MEQKEGKKGSREEGKGVNAGRGENLKMFDVWQARENAIERER